MKAIAASLLALLLSFGAGILWSQTASSSQQAARTPGTPKSAASASTTKIDPSKEADIRRLLDIGGTRVMAVQTVDQMLNTMRPVMTSSLPPGEYREKLIDLFFAKFKSKISAQDIVDLAVPIYDKHFSRDEIKGLIQFYQTPLGQKIATELPAVTTELRSAGQEWGKVLGQDAMQEVLKEHPEMLDALTKASAKNGQH